MSFSKDVASASDEVASVLERLGLKGAAAKARAFADQQRYTDATADKIDGAIEMGKAVYEQSATKRVVDAVAKKMNERPSPLRRIVKRKPTEKKQPEQE